MAFLDIIVPQYKEDETVIKNLLDSIVRQKKVKFEDLGIIIVNDASDCILSDKFLKNYKNLNIKYIKNEINVGPGKTRQNGLNISKAKYVTFVDADDELYKDESLYQILTMLKLGKYDILCSSMMQEKKENAIIKQIPLSFDALRTLHGVFIRRKYLIENEIIFHEQLRYFEDSYFINTLINAKNYTSVNNITYVWKYNEGSLTINKDNIIVKHFMDFYISIKDTYNYFKNKNVPNKEVYLLQQIVEGALVLNSSFFESEELKEKKEEYSKLIYNLYLDNLDDINKLNDLTKRRIIDFQTNDVKKFYSDIIIKESFIDFINSFKK